jgi:hypothetical protein
MNTAQGCWDVGIGRRALPRYIRVECLTRDIMNDEEACCIYHMLYGNYACMHVCMHVFTTVFTM